MIITNTKTSILREAIPDDWAHVIGGGLSGCVKSKPLGNGQIISLEVLVFVMIIAVFHKKLI